MPLGAKSQPLPSACMMKGSSPAMAAGPPTSGSGRKDGSRSTGKSGTSLPVHFCSDSSHQTYFLRSLHGRPCGSAEARL